MDSEGATNAPEVRRASATVGLVELSWLEAGDPEATPIVLLHGMPASAELWREVLVDLANAGYRALAPDLLGYGETVVPDAADHSLAASAETLVGWLRDQALAPVWLVGHDLGGAVAQVIVTQHPDVVSRLTLADTVVADNWPVPAIRLFQALARWGLYPGLAAARLIPNPYATREMRRAFARPERYDRAAAARVFWGPKVSDKRGRQSFARHLASLDPAITVTAAGNLHRVRVPTLLLWGDTDRFQPWEGSGAHLAGLIADCDTELIPDAGHFVPLERPRAFSHALLTWRMRT